MSYEGNVYQICRNGHLSEEDAFDAPEKCSFCSEYIVMEIHVDHTNGEAFGYISGRDWKRFEIEPASVQACDMGHQHKTEEARYRLPSIDEIKEVQQMWKDGRWVYLKDLKPEEGT